MWQSFSRYYFFTITLHSKVLHRIVISRFDVGKCRRPQSRTYLFFLWKILFFCGEVGETGVAVVAPFKPEFNLKPVKRKSMNFMEVFRKTVSVIPALMSPFWPLLIRENRRFRSRILLPSNSWNSDNRGFLFPCLTWRPAVPPNVHCVWFQSVTALWADYFDECLWTANRPIHFLLLIYIRGPVVSHFSSVKL